MQQFGSIAFLLALVAAGIFLVIGGRGAPATPGASGVAYTVLAAGDYSSVDRRVNYLIQSQEGLDELWKLIEPETIKPTVNFDTHSVVAVFAGEHSNPGFGIAVSKIEDGAERMVHISRIKPGDACLTAQVISHPYQVVLVPNTDLTFSHEDSWATEECAI